MMHGQRITAAAVVFCMTALAPAQAISETRSRGASQHTQHRLNVAERQAMLAQRIAKAACFVARGVTIDDHFEQLVKTRTQFEAIQVALVQGSSDLRLQPEREATILAAQNDVTEAWQKLLAPVGMIIDGETEPATVLSLQDRSVHVLGQANNVAYKIAYQYDAVVSGEDLVLTITTDVAGRQRVLLQKMVKEACLMGFTDDPGTLAETLSETVRLFDLSLTALQDGMPEAGVTAAPNSLIASALTVVRMDWVELKVLMDEAASGTTPDEDKLLLIEDAAEVILHNLEAIVSLYETL